MEEPLIAAKDVIMIYKTSSSKIKVPALRGIDLNIYKNDLISIIGPSGAGKTTLINVLGMLDRPSSGEIIYNSPDFGEIVFSKTSQKKLLKIRRKHFGFVFQSPEKNLLYKLNAVKNIIFPMNVLGKLGREERRKRAIELLERVGIKNRQNNKPTTLSRGEAQRLSIAVALANKPTIVFADEPTGELDSLNTFSIIKYLRELNKDIGTTFIVVTHDHRFSKLSDKTYRIKDGKIRSIFQPKDIEKDITSREEYIYVSRDGEIKLPDSIINALSIRQMVKVKLQPDHLEVYAAEKDKSSEK